jgi:chromate transporter
VRGAPGKRNVWRRLFPLYAGVNIARFEGDDGRMSEAPVTQPGSAAPAEAKIPITYTALYNVFFWIGLFSFGGGLMPWIQREIVIKRGWMRDEDFLPGVAMAQILPGVNSTNMAVYVGRHLLGVSGAAVAIIGMLTGPFLFMIGAAYTYKAILAVPALHAAMAGVAAAAIGMLLRMGVIAVGTSGRGVLPIVVMISVFLAIGVMKWPLVPVVLVAVPLSVLIAWPWGAKSSAKNGSDADA